jgi:hypothetical protein
MDMSMYVQVGKLIPIVQAIPQSLNTDTVIVTVLRLSDSFTWNFTSKLFTSTPATGTMTFVSDIIWQQSFTPDIEDTYVVTVYDSTLDVKYVQYLKAVGEQIAVTSTSSTSKVNIANRALHKIGAKTITLFGEDSPSARAISNCYDDMRDEVLSEHPWGFAQKRYVLALTTDVPVMTEDGMRYVYALPADLIKVNYVSQPGATYRIENGQFVSNVNGLKIIYTYRNDDPSTYFAKFISALVTRLAAEICFELTESTKKAEALYQLYEEIDLPSACSVDSQQGTPDQVIADEWEYQRNIAGASNFVIPGSQIWHPVF